MRCSLHPVRTTNLLQQRAFRIVSPNGRLAWCMAGHLAWRSSCGETNPLHPAAPEADLRVSSASTPTSCSGWWWLRLLMWSTSWPGLEVSLILLRGRAGRRTISMGGRGISSEWSSTRRCTQSPVPERDDGRRFRIWAHRGDDGAGGSQDDRRLDTGALLIPRYLCWVIPRREDHPRGVSSRAFDNY